MKLPVLLLLLLIVRGISAQGTDFTWAQTAGSKLSNESARAIVTDANGYSYVTGYVHDTAMFNNLTVVVPPVGKYSFIAKYDSSGNAVWVRTAGGGNGVWAYDICLDNHGNCYITGSFYGTAVFGNDTITVTTLQGWGSSDVFIAKYDTAGNFCWVKKAGGVNSDEGWSIAINAFGHLFVTGMFQDDAYFGNDTLSTAGSIDLFTAKFDTSGNVVWAKSGGGAAYDMGYGIAADNFGNCFVTGRFQGNAMFGNLALTSSGDYDIFIAKYNESGNVIWVQKGGGGNSDLGFGIATDIAGNCYATGHYMGSALFGSTFVSGFGSTDVFTVKYDAAGNLEWVKTAGGISGDYGIGVAADGFGNCYVTGGFYAPSASFGNTTVISKGSTDAFIVKYDGAGNFVWVSTAGGPLYEYPISLSLDSNANCYIAGRHSGTSDFGNHSITSSGNENIFIARLRDTSTLMSAMAFYPESSLTIYPNPASGELIIDDIATEITGIEIYNLPGQPLGCKMVMSNDDKLGIVNISKLHTGCYYLLVKYKNKTTVVKKFIKT